ncbi:MAG: HEAT repeat domain-containing protein [Anaerolineae bacterium]|nr:HEAT repeat domain-containing protein [Anaerolineae bacterium]
MPYDVNALTAQLQTVTTRNWKSRQEAAYRLGRSGETAAVAPLAQALATEKDIYVRMAAATALGKVGNAQAVPALIAALTDPYYLVRQNAMWALGEIGAGAQAAIPALTDMTTSTVRYDQAELTVAEIAKLVIARIEAAVTAQAAAQIAAQAAAQTAVSAPAEPASASDAAAPATATASVPAGAASAAVGVGEQGSFVERMRARAKAARDAARAAMSS